jgi:hypothetical protein
MGFRDLVLDAIRMKNSGASRMDIYTHLWKQTNTMGIVTATGDENGFEMRHTETGQVIRFDGDGYSFRAR